MFDSNGNRCLLFCQVNFFNPARTFRSMIYFCFLQPFFFSSGLVKLFKIPSAFGYTHLGDCMIILTVCLFGTRRGVLAGAIGAGLSDFLGGYAVWVLPTMLLKGLWAFIAGTIAYKLLPNFKYSWLVGAIVGGIAHIIGYTLVKIPLYDTVVAFGEMFTLSMQTIAGIVLGGVAYTILVQSPAIRTLKAKFA